jgi:hypothetical protein
VAERARQLVHDLREDMSNTPEGPAPDPSDPGSAEQDVEIPSGPLPSSESGEER